MTQGNSSDKEIAARVSRAEMVRREFGYGPRADVARAALDSLLAERENYRLALQRIENVAADEEVEYEDACDKVWKLAFDALRGGGPVGR